jgi:hypothetical protein
MFTLKVVEQWIFNSVQKMLAEQVKKEDDTAEVDETSQGNSILSFIKYFTFLSS